MEISLQRDSKGIRYEGYDKAFKVCFFEEGDVEGKNERYEFRCNYDLECCGRVCCTPTDATVPLWLMIILIVLALLLLLALFGLLAYLLGRWLKSRPKKETKETNNKYAALRSNGESDEYAIHDNKQYSTPDDIYSAYGRKYDGNGGAGSRNGWRNNGLDIERVSANGNGNGYGDGYRRRDFALTRDHLRRPSNNIYDSDNGSVIRHGVHETVEESFKQEITYERPVDSDSDSHEML
ncbi:unnamed protein product [Caenorhabditis angaria]|uniref:CX domain-containing protein n=1 Tax=Caenorhabditis angaria TaxID=860376 RepID=A0A9P1J504_9PELO|nr:unnamed protein product [Caenorhabditis angaria]